MSPRKQRSGPLEFTVQPAVVHVEEDLHSLTWCYQLQLGNRTDADLRIVEAETLLFDGRRLVVSETLGPREIARRAKPIDAARLWFQPEKYCKPHRPLVPAQGGLRWSDNYFVRPRGCWASEVIHRFVLEADRGSRLAAECRVPLKRNRQHARLRLPFDGWWQMLIGHEHFEHHMRGGGGMGLDFIGLWEGGAPHLNTGNELSDWACYRREVKAAAPGVVARVRDTSPDSLPGLPRREPVNCVNIDLGSDEQVFLAHLVPGSIVVTEGQELEAGQTVGLCGNSGYSLTPHLHIGLSRKGVGVPIVFSDYRILRPLEDAPDRFSLVQTMARGIVRHGEIVCHGTT